MYKGIFWYVPDEMNIILVKTECDENGDIIGDQEVPDYYFDDYYFLSEWTKLPVDIKKHHPYYYYPRGRVEIKEGKANIIISSVLDRGDILDKIVKEFELKHKINIIINNTRDLYYTMPYFPTVCSMCGKDFTACDYSFDYNFNFADIHSRYMEEYQPELFFNKVKLNLCYDCAATFDEYFNEFKNRVFVNCKINPLKDK